MKKLIFFLFFLVLVLFSSEQANEYKIVQDSSDQDSQSGTKQRSFFDENFQQNTLISLDAPLGIFGGFEMKFSRIADNSVMLIGGKGGFLLDHRFILGGAGYGFVPMIDLDQKNDTTIELGAGYGGIYLGYIICPSKIVHLNTGVLIGAGGAAEIKDYPNDDYDSDYNADNDQASAFFVLEPNITAEINVMKFLRLNFGVSYHYISNFKMDYIDSNDISNFAGQFSIQFGLF